ncbi:MAG: NADH-quinone oxidoreductase subunit N [Deferribacteres bacterium]|nr:NADH-quinone oxidoreductase subunit N [Deferribacteres bacterium]
MVLASTKDIYLILPEIALLVTAAVVVIVDAYSRKRGSFLNILSSIGVIVAAYLNFKLYGDHGYAFGSIIYRDKLAYFANYVFLFCAFITCFYARDYLLRENRDYGEFYALVLFATLSMMFVASSASLLMFFLSLEVVSVCLYALAGFVRDRDLCVESALKYLLVGAFSAAFSVLGMAMVYYAAGSLDISAISRADITPFLAVGLVLFAVSIFFKLSAAPFHFWAPDVYQGAPAPVTGFMMTAAKAAIFFFVVRFFMMALGVKELWLSVLIFVSVVSMVIGNFSAIRQMDVKRLLAYSSIAHAGYAMVAIASGTKYGEVATVFYAVAYCLMNLGAFAVISVLAGKDERYVNLEDLQGVAVEHPVLAAALGVFLFSLAGMPGTIGFISKFYAFAAAFKAGLYGLVLFALINSAIAAYYYLKVVYYMFMREPKKSINVQVGVATGIAVLLLVAVVIQSGITPDYLFNFARMSLP